MKTWEELAAWGKALEARGARIVAMPEGYERQKAAGVLSAEVLQLVAQSRARREFEAAETMAGEVRR